MKKKIIYSSALAALFSASIALAGGPDIIPVEDYFSGFYVGGFGAVHHVDFSGSSSVNLINFTPPPFILNPILVPGGNIITNSADGESVDGYGGINGGFGWTFQHRWYLGIYGTGEWGTQSSTNNYNVGPFSSSDFFGIIQTNTSGNNSVTQKISNDYGVGGKFGFQPYPTALIYGKVGASWAKITTSNSINVDRDFNINTIGGTNIINVHTDVTGGSSSSSTKTGLLLGIGAEQFVVRDLVSVFLEYNYVNYGTVSTGPAQLSGTTVVNTPIGPFGPFGPFNLPFTTSSNTKAKVDSFMGGINIYFGRHLSIF